MGTITIDSQDRNKIGDVMWKKFILKAWSEWKETATGES